MSEAATPAEGPLSVDQAIAAIMPEPAVEAAPEAPVEAAAEPAQEANEIEAEASPAEEPDAEPETPADGDEAPAADEPAKLDAPLYWKPEAKAVFDAMTPEQQAVVLAQEGPREEATAKAKANAAAEVEKAQKDVAGFQTLAAQLTEFLPQAVKTFQQRWGEPDWAAVAQEQGAENAFVLKSQFEAEQRQLAQIAQAEQTARSEAQKAFVQTEWKHLAELAPDLAPDIADPTKGADKRQGVVKYLSAYGIPQDAIAQISAREMTLAHKAMLYDEAQAAMKAKPPPRPAPAPARSATVRPSASVAQSSPQRSTLQQAQSRFNLSPTQENAEALLLAKQA